MRESYGPSGVVTTGGEGQLVGTEAAMAGTPMIEVSGAVVVVAAGREDVRTGCSVVGTGSNEAQRGLVVASG